LTATLEVEPERAPLAPLERDRLEDELAKLVREAASLGVCDERLGLEEPAHGMPPADERLDSTDPARREIGERLIVHLELALDEGFLQLGDEREPRRVAFLERLAVELEAARAFGSCGRERGAGVANCGRESAGL
jgi:hypothetical protein